MPTSQEIISQILFEKAQELHKKPREIVPFTHIPESDALLNNIEQFPHFFVLGCIMDRQIPAERAWNIPYVISKHCGGEDFQRFLSLDFESLNSIFSTEKLHRFNSDMASYFYQALQIIHFTYDDHAANIWERGKPTCREVIERFENFPGVGQKISTMATNILVREFKIPLENTHEIDISVDSQVEKVFKRIGFVPSNASKAQIIEAARKLYPDYPGIIDSIVWEIGRDWCQTDLSLCKHCYLNDYCPKNAISDNRPGNHGEIQERKLQLNMDKYRPRFKDIINAYDLVIPNDFYLKSTSSRTNVIITSTNIPRGIQYEFDDWGDRISIEIILDTSRLPKFQSLMRDFAGDAYENLPFPSLKFQNKWIRLQFFFNENINPSDIANAMNSLIEQTYPKILSASK